jgi:hypothetical protein
MRIKVIEQGMEGRSKIIAKVSRLMFGFTVGPLYLSIYRRDYFGTAFGRLSQSTLRQSTFWSRGEVELFGAFVSRLNQCRF